MQQPKRFRRRGKSVAALVALSLVALICGCDAPPPVRVDAPLTHVEIGDKAAGSTATDPSELFAAWSRALVRGKVDELAAFHEDSNDSVAVWSTDRTQTGLSGIRAGYQMQLDAIAWEDVSIESLTARRAHDIAWGTFRMRTTVLYRGDGRRQTRALHVSFVLRRSGNTWKIVLLHTSPRV